ncbi:hypothetical protein GCM10010394_47780 [Streptomyces crystallinus]|uniref:Uncharacterized protein n=1 Tax=Streptomyces crystallinus TaxID=68191 RepID=A0ABP3RQJ8_9ACTN
MRYAGEPFGQGEDRRFPVDIRRALIALSFGSQGKPDPEDLGEVLTAVFSAPEKVSSQGRRRRARASTGSGRED